MYLQGRKRSKLNFNEVISSQEIKDFFLFTIKEAYPYNLYNFN